MVHSAASCILDRLVLSVSNDVPALEEHMRTSFMDLDLADASRTAVAGSYGQRRLVPVSVGSYWLVASSCRTQQANVRRRASEVHLTQDLPRTISNVPQSSVGPSTCSC